MMEVRHPVLGLLQEKKKKSSTFLNLVLKKVVRTSSILRMSKQKAGPHRSATDLASRPPYMYGVPCLKLSLFLRHSFVVVYLFNSCYSFICGFAKQDLYFSRKVISNHQSREQSY